MILINAASREPPITANRLSFTQVHQGDQRHTPFSATSLACLGERARVAPRGSWLTGDHDKFAGLDAHNLSVRGQVLEFDPSGRSPIRIRRRSFAPQSNQAPLSDDV